MLSPILMIFEYVMKLNTLNNFFHIIFLYSQNHQNQCIFVFSISIYNCLSSVYKWTVYARLQEMSVIYTGDIYSYVYREESYNAAKSSSDCFH